LELCEIIIENVAIANALQLEAARRRASRSRRFLASFVLRMRVICYFAASDRHSDIAVRFGDHDFLKFGDQTTFTRCDLDL